MTEAVDRLERIVEAVQRAWPGSEVRILKVLAQDRYQIRWKQGSRTLYDTIDGIHLNDVGVVSAIRNLLDEAEAVLNG